ncbi:MAG: hypothetical protein WDM90_24575 [Ferruginibacter sp.]
MKWERWKKLEFKNVTFRHKSATEHSIDNISFKAQTGDSIAFVGPSGSGKIYIGKIVGGLVHSG